MLTIAYIISILLLVLGSLIVVGNYAGIIATSRNKAKGINKHVSMIFVVPQILLCFSTIFGFRPYWIPAIIGLLDPSLWCLVYLPVYMLLKRNQTK